VQRADNVWCPEDIAIRVRQAAPVGIILAAATDRRGGGRLQVLSRDALLAQHSEHHSAARATAGVKASEFITRSETAIVQATRRLTWRTAGAQQRTSRRVVTGVTARIGMEGVEVIGGIFRE